MPRGQADYGITTQTPVASGISDPGEAAARLGSINVYDRRGWTVWMDDFEAPKLKWSTDCTVGGTLPVLSTTKAWMGAQSLYFVTAAVALEATNAYIIFPLIRQGRVGLEFWVYLNTKTPNYFKLFSLIHDGANVSQSELRLNWETKTATIVTPTGHVIIATNCFNTVNNNVWTPVKLVIDIDTDHYFRLMIGSQEIDLSAYSLATAAATTLKFITASLSLWGGVAGVGSAYIDNFILTQNEP